MHINFKFFVVFLIFWNYFIICKGMTINDDGNTTGLIQTLFLPLSASIY